MWCRGRETGAEVREDPGVDEHGGRGRGSGGSNDDQMLQLTRDSKDRSREVRTC